MTFSLHEGGVVMSSQIKHTHSHQDTPLSPYTWHLSLDFQLLSPFYSLFQPHHVTVSHPSACDNQQSMGGWSERTQCQAKMAAWNSFNYICTRALHSFRSFGKPWLSFFCCLRPSSHHPSSLILASLGHQHPSGHTVIIHSFHMPKPSQYSLICSSR